MIANRYTKGEVVWAKLKGFPWWPAIVTQNSQFSSINLMKI